VRYCERRTTMSDAGLDKLAEKLLVAVIATCGHGLYVGYKYLRYGRVNPISVGLLIFMASVTIVGLLYYLYVRRSRHARSPTNPSSAVLAARNMPVFRETIPLVCPTTSIH